MSAKDYLPEGKYAKLPNGYTMHYLDEGDGPAVVWLHGSGSGASGYSNFKGNYPVVAKHGYRSIVIDHIGYGFSDKPDDVEYHLDFFVECLKQTLDSAGVDKCSLVGNSLGGAIALKFALDYPDSVDKLILMAPGGVEEQADYFKMPGMALMREVFTSPSPMTVERMKQFFIQAFVVDPSCVEDDMVVERFETMKLQNPQVITSMKVPNLTDRLGEIGAKTLVFWGVDERMMPETGIMKLAKGIPDCRLILQSQCGHWVMIEHRELFNRMCVDFLDNS